MRFDYDVMTVHYLSCNVCISLRAQFPNDSFSLNSDLLITHVAYQRNGEGVIVHWSPQCLLQSKSLCLLGNMVGLVLVYLRNSPATAHLTSHNGTVPSAGMNKKPVTGMKPLQTLMQDAFFLHFCIKWTRTWLTELEQTEFPKKFLIVSAFYSPLTRCSLSRVHSFRVEFGAPPCNKPSCTCRAGTLLCR